MSAHIKILQTSYYHYIQQVFILKFFFSKIVKELLAFQIQECSTVNLSNFRFVHLL